MDMTLKIRKALTDKKKANREQKQNKCPYDQNNL